MLGWIDYSKTERDKVLGVLDLLSESGTLDELGIAPIRDGFANIFFPGTSTIQTRAKYFFIIPYALMDLEYGKETNPSVILKEMTKTEKSCCEIFMSNNPDDGGIIGRRSLGQKNWVRRTPADIYWAGLRRYGLFSGGNITMSEYIRAFCGYKKNKDVLESLGNRNDEAEEFAQDDRNAGGRFFKKYWNIPMYESGWKEHLDMRLTKEEGGFLLDQIVSECNDSLMAYILKHGEHEILEAASFKELESLIHLVPERIQNDYHLARAFSDFIFVLRILFNVIVSEGKNELANRLWSEHTDKLASVANIDLPAILARIDLSGNIPLVTFLKQAREEMQAGHIDALKKMIIRRESFLKGQSRAKTAHPGEFDTDAWFCGGELDYRFSNAKVIMQDIFESVNVC